MSEAIVLFMAQIKLNKGIPFAIKLPNKETKTVLDNADNGKNLPGYALIS